MATKEQQGSLSAKDRLAQISHHFLSDDGAEHPLPRTVAPTWGLISPPHIGQGLPWHMLGQALSVSGLSTLVLDTSLTPPIASWLLAATTDEGRLQQLIGRGCGTVAPLIADHISRDRTPDICLQVAAHHDDAVLYNCDFLLLAAGTDVPALRIAYGVVKKLAAKHPRAKIGVTIVGAPDEHIARHSYLALATAAQRFLSKDVMSFGYVSYSALRTRAEEDGATSSEQVLREEMRNVAALIATEKQGTAPR